MLPRHHHKIEVGLKVEIEAEGHCETSVEGGRVSSIQACRVGGRKDGIDDCHHWWGSGCAGPVLCVHSEGEGDHLGDA